MDAKQFTEIEAKMQKKVDALAEEYSSIRAGRANPKILDKVHADYYGTPTPITQMAAIAVSEARILVIQPWDVSSLKAIEKAVNASDIGINPQNDGKSIRLIFPPLTEERRKELVKTVHKYGEECKVSVRNVRRDAIEKFKKDEKAKVISEDDRKEAEKKVQDITDKYCKKVDEVSAEKQKEILSL
ncbi:MAG: ribosome recycling factor [Oscillospiraceae bacterium]|jgi:ribosome recycling factor|nr:ribosome recycling factor [Oscillospiraceae bacterium]